jgi:nucleoid DNA-binding protein
MAENTPATTKTKSITKSQLFQELADASGLKRQDVSKVFEQLSALIKKELGKKGPGVLSLPGLVKITRVVKPATKATTKPNPFKPGEMMTVKAKKASTTVKVRPLKDLREIIS